MPQIGDILDGKYSLIERIGQGGMGSVYLAEHQQIDKKVAVKVLHPQLSADQHQAARFTREAQAAGAIGHRSIIDIHDVGTADDGSMFLVMEYLEGTSLGQALKQTGPLDVPFAAYVVCQVLSALHAAHSAGIIHRDLKPDNIFLVDSGQALPGVKLLDFGISKVTRPADGEAHLTQTGALMGTPYYMAPEQAQGARDLDHRVDIYALGVILYECLTGRVPFNAENAFALAFEIVMSPLVTPRQLRPELPEALEVVILTAMAREPEARYAGAMEMLEQLGPFLDEQGVAFLSLPKDSVPPSPTRTNPISGIDSKRRTPGWSRPGTSDGTLRETPAPAARGLGRWRWAIGGFAALFLVFGALAIVAVLWVLDDRPGDRATPPPAPAASAPEPEGSPSEAAENTPETEDVPPAATEPRPERETERPGAPPEDIAVTLTGLPPEAQVFLGEDPVDGAVLHRPASDEPFLVRVEAQGYRPWQERIVFDRDRTVRVHLEPVRSASTAGRRGGSSGADRPSEGREEAAEENVERRDSPPSPRDRASRFQTTFE